MISVVLKRPVIDYSHWPWKPIRTSVRPVKQTLSDAPPTPSHFWFTAVTHSRVCNGWLKGSWRVNVRQKRFWSGRSKNQQFTSAMDRTTSSVLLRIAFLLLVGAFSVHTRSLESPGKSIRSYNKKMLSSNIDKHCFDYFCCLLIFVGFVDILTKN